MLVQKLNDAEEFIAGDGTRLRELLHPDKQPIELRYSLAHAIVPVGQTSIPHSLTTSEVYYLLRGKGEMHVDDEVQIVEVGDKYLDRINYTKKQFKINSFASCLLEGLCAAPAAAPCKPRPFAYLHQ